MPIGFDLNCSESKANKHRKFSIVAEVKNWCKSNVIEIQSRLIKGQTGIFRHI